MIEKHGKQASLYQGYRYDRKARKSYDREARKIGITIF